MMMSKPQLSTLFDQLLPPPNEIVLSTIAMS